MERPSVTYIILRAMNVCLGSLYLGYSLSILNLSQVTIFEFLNINSTILDSLSNSSVVIGALLGVIISGVFVNRFSRRHFLFIIDLIGSIGVLVCAYPNKYIFLVGRLLVGIAAGMNS
jgi:MFS family permease